MEILEQFIKGKSDRSCDDRIVITDNHLFILDGATVKSKTNNDNPQQLLDLAVDSINSFSADISLRECVDIFTELSSDINNQNSQSVTDFNLKPSFVFTAYSNALQQVWRVGDTNWSCQGVIHYGGKLIDQINASARAAYLNCLIEQGTSIQQLINDDPGRQLIMPLLKQQAAFANNPKSKYGYPVINGQYVPDQFLEATTITGGLNLILTSDGYPVLKDSLLETEAALTEILLDDPLMINYHPATKGVIRNQTWFDDRAWVKILT
jgi:glycerophosphoryl diester phosphodiesterase